MNTFGEFSGKSFNSSTLNDLTFSYDLRRCGKVADSDKLFRCAFHIVCFTNSTNPATYLLTFS